MGEEKRAAVQCIGERTHCSVATSISLEPSHYEYSTGYSAM